MRSTDILANWLVAGQMEEYTAKHNLTTSEFIGKYTIHGKINQLQRGYSTFQILQWWHKTYRFVVKSQVKA